MLPWTRTSPADRQARAGAVSRRRTAPGELLATLGELGAEADSALLVVRLHRSDRLDALAQTPASRQATDELASRVESVLRTRDVYAIASPEEIWIALTGAPVRAIAELAARRIHAVLSRPLAAMHAGTVGDPAPVRVHPAIGVAHPAAVNANSLRALLAHAHDASRKAGRTQDRIIVAESGPLESEIEIERRSAEIRAAIQGNDLEVFFQPQAGLQDGRCLGAEALIRWPGDRPERISPQEIVSVAESDGLMPALTMFVLNNSLRNLAQWREQGFDMNVSVNISAQSLVDRSLPSLIQRALETWGIESPRLTLEITENLIVSNESSALDFMRELRATGVELSLDDFGTGYSSLAYLSRFPVTELKIDQSFVIPLGSESGDRRIVSAMLQLSRTFGLRTVAEGVESQQVASILRDLGCAVAQGHHVARPMGGAAMAQWLLGSGAGTRRRHPRNLPSSASVAAGTPNRH